MSKKEKDAIAWAVRRLKGCHDDSKKALAKGVLAMTAHDNVQQYEVLAGMVKEHKRWAKW
jgi:hypothetical protein